MTNATINNAVQRAALESRKDLRMATIMSHSRNQIYGNPIGYRTQGPLSPADVAIPSPLKRRATDWFWELAEKPRIRHSERSLRSEESLFSWHSDQEGFIAQKTCDAKSYLA